VNSPAIPFNLAESELFGYEKGAFSGARSDGKIGKFELSDGGTIFLDEISCLPLGIQSKLLRVLEEKEIEKLGGRNPIKLDFRLIAATNISLEEFVKAGHFREDLFYRLNSVQINIPPVRERKEDIPLYINHYLERINRSFRTNIKAVSDDALQRMMNYNWPGNVRELMHALEHSVINVIEGHVILPENLPPFLSKKDYKIASETFGLKGIIEQVEKQAIERTLILTNGNKRKAASLLKIQRSVLYKKLKKYQILPERVALTEKHNEINMVDADRNG
jgi:transcriptional regulator with PAS, ATPase and Fis domain